MAETEKSATKEPSPPPPPPPPASEPDIQVPDPEDEDVTEGDVARVGAQIDERIERLADVTDPAERNKGLDELSDLVDELAEHAVMDTVVLRQRARLASMRLPEPEKAATKK